MRRSALFRELLPYQVATDVSVAGVFGLLCLPFELTIGGWAAESALPTVVMCLLFAAALALRRLSPPLALATAWVGATMQMLMLRPPAPVDLAIFAVLYATAAYGSTLVYWLGFSSAIVGATVITGYLFGTQLLSVASWSVLPLAAAVLVAAGFALLLAWTVGALVRTSLRARRTQRERERAERERVEEQERGRIARDMHDVVGHSLAVIIAQADGARYAADADPQAAKDALATISTTARSALADVRLLLAQLRHSEGVAPQPMLNDLEGLYGQVRAAGLAVRVDVEPMPPPTVPAAVQLAIYRVLQEALTNAIRHGNGDVEVTMRWLPDRLHLWASNPVGQRVDPPPADADRLVEPAEVRHGIVGMRERARLVGGAVEAGMVGEVWVVRATFPFAAEPELRESAAR
ncbi:sensor histidine kinase [Microbacterium schleiferi]|uniref:sensor histidine kinase n=1 Tax=Microbacterium schleiferi TaxID=69362 RepID=UPI00311DF77E